MNSNKLTLILVAVLDAILKDLLDRGSTERYYSVTA